MDTELLKRITVIPGLMSGKPTIRGMRFPVGDILEMLANDMTIEEILEQHPILEKRYSGCFVVCSFKNQKYSYY